MPDFRHVCFEERRYFQISELSALLASTGLGSRDVDVESHNLLDEVGPYHAFL